MKQNKNSMSFVSKKNISVGLVTSIMIFTIFSFQNCGNKMSANGVAQDSLATLSPAALRDLTAGKKIPDSTDRFTASVDADKSVNVVVNVKFDKTSFAANEPITGRISLLSNTTFTGSIVFSGKTQAAQPFNIPYNNINFEKDVKKELSFTEINGGRDPIISVNGEYPWTAKITVGGKSFSTTRIVHIGSSNNNFLEYATTMKIAPGPYTVGNAIDGQICIQSNIAFTGVASGTVKMPACAGGTLPFNHSGINFKVGTTCYTLEQAIGKPAKPTCAGLYTLDVSLTVAGEASANITWDISAQ